MEKEEKKENKENENQEKWREAGKIASEVLSYAKSIIKPEMPLLEIAEKIEKKIKELGARSAFPINLSMNEIAAHCSPQTGDESKAGGLLKVDVGISVDGYISDTAFSVDLSPEQKYKKLIEASEEALRRAIKVIKAGVTLGEIGKVIQEAISSKGLAPVRNLSGHEIKRYKVHAGLTVPNYDNKSKVKLEENQIVAIEPFATTGEGIVQDSRESGIYHLIEKKPVRDMKARELLEFIQEEYKEMPFSARWLVDKFGTRALFSLRLLEQAESLHHFKQLVEKSRAPVSQAEHTVLVTKSGCEVLT